MASRRSGRGGERRPLVRRVGAIGAATAAIVSSGLRSCPKVSGGPFQRSAAAAPSVVGGQTSAELRNSTACRGCYVSSRSLVYQGVVGASQACGRACWKDAAARAVDVLTERRSERLAAAPAASAKVQVVKGVALTGRRESSAEASSLIRSRLASCLCAQCDERMQMFWLRPGEAALAEKRAANSVSTLGCQTGSEGDSMRFLDRSPSGVARWGK